MSDDLVTSVDADIEQLLKEIDADRESFLKQIDSDILTLSLKVHAEKNTWRDTREELKRVADKEIDELETLAKNFLKES